jgi:hypothetical protein
MNDGNDEQIFNFFIINLHVIYLQLNLNSTQLIANPIPMDFNSIQLNLIKFKPQGANILGVINYVENETFTCI